MESKLADESKGDDVENIDISSSNQRLYPLNSEEPLHPDNSEEPLHPDNSEDPLHPDKVGNGIILSKEENADDGQSSLQSTTTDQQPHDGSGYRIPPYVFAKNRSGNPMEWSINSNDSLFSIQMGTASFTHDQINWLMKSEEHGEGYQHLDPHQPAHLDDDLHPFGDQISTAEPLESPSEPHNNTETSTDTSTSTELTTVNAEEDPDDQPASWHPGKEESKINANHNPSNSKFSLSDEQTRHSARCSDASGQSFAFPLLSGELDRGNSVKSSQTPQEKLQEKTKEQSHHKTSSSNIDEAQGEVEIRREAPQSSSWFSGCFSCCSNRS